MDLPEVADQRLLIDDLEHVDQPMAAQGASRRSLRIALQEHVTREQRHDRLDLPSLRRATFFEDLGKVIDDPGVAKLTGGRLLLTRLGMQAPPDGLILGPMDATDHPRGSADDSRARQEESASRSS